MKLFNQLNPLAFDRAWLFLPISIATIFGVPGVFGIWYLGGAESFQLLEIVFVGVFVLVGGYLLLEPHSERVLKHFPSINLRESGVDLLVLFFSVAYFSVVGYAVITAEKIALIEALKGADLLQITEAREALFKTRTGAERLLPYLNAMLSTALMPYSVAVAFVYKRKYAPLLLLFFILSLMPSLEKALVLKAILPVFLLATNRFVSRKFILILPVVAFVVIVGSARLVGISAGVPSASSSTAGEMVEIQKDKWIRMQDHLDKYFPLRGNGAIGYLINRAFWIPYVTAYDWLRYFNFELKGHHLNGRTSLMVSKILGESQYPMEQNVFKYQYGYTATPTATANTNFLVDAFVNFGWIGVILLSAFVAFFLVLLKKLGNPAASACAYFFMFQLLGGGFVGVFIGGGLFLFICLICVIRLPSARALSAD